MPPTGLHALAGRAAPTNLDRANAALQCSVNVNVRWRVLRAAQVTHGGNLGIPDLLEVVTHFAREAGLAQVDERDNEAGLAVRPARGGCGSICLLYTSPSPRDRTRSRMPSSA